ncbi:MAG: heat-inducible transcription repressor HrcA [Candidatus Latescibacteria bacterium]|nr:heat-inducible transcription repressor HrcA [Candidatus Latescibacterota bacterium]
MINQQERRDIIIEAVVSSFLETGEPVSSAHVAEMSYLGLSSATIRNIMKELEKEGYLAHPHTSAGRIPTVECYRYYVKHLMHGVDPSDVELQDAKRLLESVMREKDAEIFMSHIAKALSEVTDLIGVVMSPSFESGIFDRLEIVAMGGSRYLVIISLNNGIVKTINLTVDRVLPRTRVDETARLLSGRLHGLTVAEIKRSIGERLKGLSGGDRSLFDVILDNRNEIFNFTGDNNLHVAGLSRLLAHSESVPIDYTLKLVDLFEHKSKIAHSLNLMSIDDIDVKIHIGGSGVWGSAPELTMVSAGFRLDDAKGAVAVIGPTRIHYPKLSAIIKYTAQITGLFFSNN